MATIKLKTETKAKLDTLMAIELRHKLEKAKPKEKTALFILLVRQRYGITYDSFINVLIERYTKTTK